MGLALPGATQQRFFLWKLLSTTEKSKTTLGWGKSIHLKREYCIVLCNTVGCYGKTGILEFRYSLCSFGSSDPNAFLSPIFFLNCNGLRMEMGTLNSLELPGTDHSPTLSSQLLDGKLFCPSPLKVEPLPGQTLFLQFFHQLLSEGCIVFFCWVPTHGGMQTPSVTQWTFLPSSVTI